MNDNTKEEPVAGAGRATESDTPSRARAKQDAFLQAIAIFGFVTLAAEAADIHRSQHYRWLKEDPDYIQRFRDAEGAFADGIRQEVFERAINGWDEPVFQSGRQATDAQGRAAVIRRKSDRLLELLAKAKCPEFRATIAVTGEGGGPLEVAVVRYPVKETDPEAWSRRAVASAAARDAERDVAHKKFT